MGHIKHNDYYNRLHESADIKGNWSVKIPNKKRKLFLNYNSAKTYLDKIRNKKGVIERRIYYSNGIGWEPFATYQGIIQYKGITEIPVNGNYENPKILSKIGSAKILDKWFTDLNIKNGVFYKVRKYKN
jgi:hypothetical protein